MEIQGRIALVTGAAAGTGRAIALRLGREGAAVVVADVDEPGGQDTVRAVEGGGGRACFVRADMTDDDDIARMIASARDWGGGLHIVVNNAGGGGHIPPHYPEATPAQWGATLDLNLRGPMLATQLALDAMRADGGGVVNVASTAGLGLAPYQSPEYGAAKAGLIRFTSTLTDLGHVRVNCVVPDWIATERAQAELAAMTAEERADAPTPVPMEDVADAVVELIQTDALAGRVVLLRGGEPRRLLPADGPP
jgi:NAD(P)-dependent dehydrogenase (short-subunit alcohol dehydrogenase family)